MAFDNAENNGYRYNSHYTADEAEMVDKAKRTHRETTSSAQRALKVVHLHRHGLAQQRHTVQDVPLCSSFRQVPVMCFSRH